MSASALRDHADQILTAIIHDMKSQQSAAEQAEKSKGRGSAQHLAEIGKLHAGLRIDRGFKLGQIVAEYRALRASVLRLWERAGTDPGGVTRFNEAIDEALTEAVEAFVKATAHFRDQSLGILGHDLRNPLSSIVVGATLLMNSEALDDQSARTAMRILHSAKRMSRMIEDLLDWTRTRFGDQIPIVPTPLDLAPLCQEVIAEFEGHYFRRAPVHSNGRSPWRVGQRPHRPGALEPRGERDPARGQKRSDQRCGEGQWCRGLAGGSQQRSPHTREPFAHHLRTDGSSQQDRAWPRPLHRVTSGSGTRRGARRDIYRRERHDVNCAFASPCKALTGARSKNRTLISCARRSASIATVARGESQLRGVLGDQLHRGRQHVEVERHQLRDRRPPHAALGEPPRQRRRHRRVEGAGKPATEPCMAPDRRSPGGVSPVRSGSVP